jgi:phage-related tail fiber protein
MSRKFLTNIDLSQNQLENARIQNSTTAPSSPVSGQVYYDNNSGVNRLKVWNGTAWVTLLASSNTLNDLANNDGDYDMGGFTLTNLGTPGSSAEAATKGYVDTAVSAAKQGLDVKDSVLYASTTGENVSISTTTAITLDGASRTLTTGQTVRVLLKNQTTGSQNGIYDYNNTGGEYSLTRSADANTSAKVTSGMFTFVETGTANADSGWVLTTDGTITLDTTDLAFTQFTGAGQITAGAGMTKTGNTLNVITASTARIVVNADSIDLAQPTITATSTPGTTIVQDVTVDVYGRVTGYSEVTRKFAQSNPSPITPSGNLATWAVTHNLGTTDVVVAVYEVSTSRSIEVDVTITSTNVVTLTWNTLNNNTISSGVYKIVVLS